MYDMIPQDTPQKQCSKCRQFKPCTREFFSPDKNSGDGLAYYCKKCRNDASRAKAQANKKPIVLPPPLPEGYKRCRDCEQVLLATTEFFSKTALYQSPDGLCKSCKVCRKAYRQSRSKSRPPIPTPRQSIRQCDDCEQFFPADLEHFSIDRSNPDCLKTVCKPCANIRSQNYRDRDGGKEARKAYRQVHSEHDKQYRKAYRDVHKEHESQYGKAYREAHQEEERAYRRAYRQSHQEELRVKCLNRIARKKAIPGKYTLQDVRDKYQRQKGRCYYCGKKFGKGKNAFHVDHVIPLAREGSTNWPDNIVLACPPCNTSKGDKLLHEWPRGGRLF